MADAKPSLSSGKISVTADPKAVEAGKPRVKDTTVRSPGAKDFKKGEVEDRPHTILEDTSKHTITQLRSGTTKTVRK